MGLVPRVGWELKLGSGVRYELVQAEYHMIWYHTHTRSRRKEGVIATFYTYLVLIWDAYSEIVQNMQIVAL